MYCTLLLLADGGKLQIYHGDGFRNRVSNYRHSMTTNNNVFYSLMFSVASQMKEENWKVTLAVCLNLGLHYQKLQCIAFIITH